MPAGPFKHQAAARSWLLEEWTKRFAAAVDSMTGQTAAVASAASPVPIDCSWYEEEFSIDGASLVAGASPAEWLRLGGAALIGAGLTDVADDDALGTCLELLAQASSGLAQAVGQELSREVTAQPPRVAGDVPLAGEASAFTFDLGTSGTVTLFVATSAALSGALMGAVDQAVETAPPAASQSVVQAPPAPPSRTLDLLMEVELPVSISFGRASLPLREVLKLNSGSIIELNRTISEPVEMVVNNCVIARGEVVVVDGNDGIRIQQVVSREERLRSLN